MLKEDFQVSRIIGSNLQVYDLGNKEARPTLSLIFFYLRFFFFLLLANGLFLLFSANLAALALLYILWLFRSLSLSFSLEPRKLLARTARGVIERRANKVALNYYALARYSA